MLVPSIQISPNCCKQRLGLICVTDSKIRKPKPHVMHVVWVSIYDESIKYGVNIRKVIIIFKNSALDI